MTNSFEKTLKDKMAVIIRWQTKDVLPDLNIDKILDFHFKIFKYVKKIILGLIAFYLFIIILPKYFTSFEIIILLLIGVTLQIGELNKKFGD